MTFDEWYEQQNKGHSDSDKADMRAAWNFATTQGADARPVATCGWTGNPEIDAALIMLDRLDVQSDDDTRIDAISNTLRRLATRDAVPSDAPIGYVNSMWAEHRVGTTKIYPEAHPRLATFPVFAAIAPREAT